MPTFSAITFDRFLEPGATKSESGRALEKEEKKKEGFLKSDEKFKLGQNQEKSSPATLYKTPEIASVPDSPFSLPPSPYVVNHKRRGPNLLKSFSQGDVLERAAVEIEEEKGKGKGKGKGKEKEKEKVSHSHSLEEVSFMEMLPGIGEEEVAENGFDEEKKVDENGGELDENGFDDGGNGLNGGKVEINFLNYGLGEGNGNDTERDDFFDPQESLSVTSTTEGEDNVWGERSFKFNVATSEFYDACEELSSGSSHHFSFRDFDTELRDVRLNLLMEIERRKRVEDALHSMERQWERLREQLSLVGVTLPSARTISAEDEKLDFDPAVELCQQVSVARVVADAVGRGSAKAEAEMEMESRLESKNFEIARLSDRLHYYETVNHEMSQRNQEALEIARHQREIRKRRQRWIWSSIGVTIALGSAALAWSYLPTSRGSSSADSSLCPESVDAAEQ